MCTLPSEGVSFCLSAAAKSLLNKKADVKVSLLVSSLTFCVLLSLSLVPSHCPLHLKSLYHEHFTQRHIEHFILLLFI